MDLLDYHLPPHLIAQTPTSERDAARLLVVPRNSTELLDHHIRDLPDLLNPGDLLVLNDSRVLPARLIGHREQTGGKWEGLFLREDQGVWELLTQTRGKPEIGEFIVIKPGALRLELLGRREGHWLAKPSLPGSAIVLLTQFGRVPLPPYIRKGTAAEPDRGRYQTVFAKADGSVAAPTAGLHFTTELLDRLHARGITTATVTLHVGLGTFESIAVSDYTQHRMHAEWGEVSTVTVQAIRDCRARGGRIIAVGTTATRALESAASDGEIKPWQGETDIFIHPPYTFRVIDGLLTNFHLPRTTLLLLVAALAGPERLRTAYAAAIQREYRFYSYGDAMLLI